MHTANDTNADGEPQAEDAERKRAEGALREREATLKALLNAPQETVALLDPDGVLLSINESGARRLGSTPGELIGRNVYTILPPDVAQSRKAHIDRVFQTGEAVHFEDSRSGMHISNSIYPVFDEQGERVTSVAVFASDITERVQAQEALHESEERYRELFGRISSGVAVYEAVGDGEDFVFRDFNQAGTKIDHISKEKAIGRKVSEVFPGVVDFGLFEVLRRVWKTGQAEHFPTSLYQDERIRGWRENYVYKLPSGEVVAVYDDITERKQVEEALAHERDLLHALMDNIPDFIYFKDADSRFTRVNKAQAGLLGVGDPGEVIGKTDYDFFTPEFARQAYADEQELMKSGQLVTGKVERDERQGGQIRWLSATKVPLRDKEGRITGMVGISRDITKLKQAEEAEREQRALAEALADTAAALNSTLDLDEVLERILSNVGQVVPHDAANIMLLEANGATARVAGRRGYTEQGIKKEERPERNVLAELPNLRHMVESGQPLAIPDTQASPDWVPTPATRWARSYAGAPIHLKGHVVGLLNLLSAAPGFFTPAHAERLQAFADTAAAAIQNARLYQELENYSDFLEEEVKQRTEELRRTTDRVEAILNSVGEALMVVKPNGRIQQVNPAFEVQTGYPAREVELHHYAVLLEDEATAHQLIGEIDTAAGDGQPWRGELPIRRKDGTVYDAAVTFAPMYRRQDEVSAFVASIRDVSAQKEVARMKDAFVSNVSHELRTPITGLKLFLGLLETAPPEKRDEYLPTLKREADRLNRIIEDVLRLSRLDQGRVEMKLTEVDLNALAGQYVADRAPLADSRGLSLTLELEPDMPLAQADEGLLGQVLSVMLTNALNYTPEGGRVVVRTQSQELEGKQWVGFSVYDTGPGIPPEEQEQLFERFFRGSVGRESGSPGTGLGLSIAQEIVSRHNGRIEVESEGVPGKGTTFTMWLPAEE